MPYFKANKATSEKIESLLKDRQSALKKAKKLARKYGAKAPYYFESFGRLHFSGFAFDEPPDSKVWCAIKSTHDGWRPRSNKTGKVIRSELDALTSHAVADIEKLLGLTNTMTCVRGEMRMWQPGLFIHNGRAYVSTPDYVKTTPKGCTRITDVTWEKAHKAA